MCAATGTWAGAAQEKEPGLFSVRRSLSLPHSAALLTTQPLTAAHLPPHPRWGQFPLVVIALLRQLFLCLSARLRCSGEGVRPGVVVSPGPLSRRSRGGGRGVFPGREAREGPVLGAKGYKGLC